MGLVGFANERYYQSLLRTRCANLQWESSPVADADALWICGDSATLSKDAVVQVAGHDGTPDLKLDLQTLRHPTFFTLPLRDPRIRPALSFDPRSAPDIDKALRRAEAVLRPLGSQLAIAHANSVRLPQLGSATYHLTRDARLLAVVNLGSSVGISPQADVPQLEGAEWRALPRGASTIPSHFLTVSFAELLWVYIARERVDLLPPRYRRSPLFFRAIPAVPQRLIKDTHYAILSDLDAEPQTFSQLQVSLGLSESALAQALAPLYYAGAVTTNPSRAAKGASGRVREAEFPSELRESMFSADASQAFSSFLGRGADERPTMPASLEPKPYE